jgi:hypothetical protein
VTASSPNGIPADDWTDRVDEFEVAELFEFL